MRDMFALTLLLTAALPAQCPPPYLGKPEPPPPPPPPVWGGPGDISIGPPVGSGPAAPMPAVAHPSATPVAPRARHQLQLPPQIAQALQRYGAPVQLVHEHTALSRLTYDWEYAKVIAPPPEGNTVAPPRPRALPLAEAIARVAGADRRPFLILRECWRCGSSDESEIGRKMANEKTILLGKWFRCVRVSDAVRHADHPLHAIFAGAQAPHLVFGNSAGEITPVESGTPLSALWSIMRAHIAQAYDGDADAAVSELLAMLSLYDHLDNMELEVANQLDAAMQSKAATSPQVATLRRRLAGLADERAALRAREAKALALVLRPTLRRS